MIRRNPSLRIVRSGNIRSQHSWRAGRSTAQLLESLESRMLLSTVTVSPAVVTASATSTTATLTATLDAPSTSDVVLTYSTQNGSAKKSLNYTATSSTLTIPAGQTTGTFTIPILPNDVYRSDTDFFVNLSVNKKNQLAQRRVAVTIQNNQSVPTVTIGDTTVVAGTHGQMLKIPVTLSNPSSQWVKIHYSTDNVTALRGTNYWRSTGTLIFAPGEITRYIHVWIKKDTTGGTDTAFNIQLKTARHADLELAPGSDVQYARVAIKQSANTTISRPTISISDASANAGAAETFTVTLSQASTQNVAVRYHTVPGTATSSDFVPVDGVLTIPAGSTTGTITVETHPASGPADTRFQLALTAPTNADLGTSSANGTIITVLPSLSISNASVTEGNSGTSTMTYTVTLSAPCDYPVSVDYATADGTATVGSDYVAANGTLTFAPGETSKSIAVTVNGDTTVEPDETVNLALSNPANATLENATAVGTILTDDLAGISVSSPSISMIRNDGNQQLTFTVTLSSASTVPVSVDYATADGTATAGVNSTDAYMAANGTLTFAPGETSKTVSVTIRSQSPYTTESFSLDLSNAHNGTLTNGTGTGTILYGGSAIADNLAATPVDGWTITNTDWSAQRFTSWNDGSLLKSITLAIYDYDQANVTAEVYTDNGNQPGTRIATLQGPTNDLVVSDANQLAFVKFDAPEGIALDPNTSYWVVLSSATSAYFGARAASVNDPASLGLGSNGCMNSTDAGGTWSVMNSFEAIQTQVITEEFSSSFPAISINSPTVSETSATPSTQTMTYTVSLDHASTFPITVNYATADGSAAAGVDYTAANGTLTFAPGETSKTIDVLITGETVAATEHFSLTLSNATYATIATGTGVGTIQFETAATLSDNYAGADAGMDNSPWVAADFSTGDGGAVLQSVTLALTTSSGVTVSIYSDNGGHPGVLVGTLTHSTGDTFTSDGLSLAANTRYWVVAQNGEWTYALNGSQTGSGYVGDFAMSTDGSAWSVNTSTGRTFKMQVNALVAGAPTLSIAPASVQEVQGDITDQTMSFTATLSTAVPFPVTVYYATSDGTAVAGTDYTAATGTLTFAPGETSKTISITVTGDTVAPTETFNLSLSNATNATIATATGVGTIQYVVPTSLSDNLATSAIGYGGVGSTQSFAAPFSTSSASLTLTSIVVPFKQISAGTVTVAIYSDNAGMPGSLVGTLASPGGYSTGSFSATTFAASNITLDPNSVYWVVFSSNDGTFGVSVTSDLTGSGVGYLSTDAMYSHDNGLSWGDDGDLVQMQVNALAPGVPALSIAPASVQEVQGNISAEPMNFTVTLSEPAPFPVTVHYATSDGTAVAGTDYAAATGTLTFAPGETSKTIAVTVTGVSVAPSEGFNLTLSSPTNASVTTGNAVGTIEYAVPVDLSDNLAASSDGWTCVTPTQWLASSFSTGATEVGLSSVELNFGQGISGSVTAMIYSDNGGQPGTVVGTLTSPGSFSSPLGAATFTANGITLSANTTYWVVLTAGSGSYNWSVTLGSTGTGSGFISANAMISHDGVAWTSDGDFAQMQVNVDAPAVPALSIAAAPGNIVEDPASPTTQTMNFTVTLDSAVPFPVTVQYVTSDGTATAGTDYVATSGSLTFAPGETSKTIAVTITNDSISADATLNLSLSNPTHATITTDTGIGTIHYGTTLSNNLSNDFGSTSFPFTSSQWIASSFSTGASSYQLDSIETFLNVGPGITPTVAIYSDNAGMPGTLVGTLTNPATLGYWNFQTFTATGITLAASTTYWVVYSSNDISYSSALGMTTSPLGSGPGFIAADSLYSSDNGASWNDTGYCAPLSVIATPGV